MRLFFKRQVVKTNMSVKKWLATGIHATYLLCCLSSVPMTFLTLMKVEDMENGNSGESDMNEAQELLMTINQDVNIEDRLLGSRSASYYFRFPVR